MANNKLTLAVAINLLTENFKKGTNQVVNGFKSMQVRVTAFITALGFGTIGLTNFISKLIQTAKETSRVTTMLKNISGGTATYVENQKYLNKMAKDYSLDINSLTENFAKFSASATAGGMALDQQRKIFESVSKSVAAFGLTSQEANGVFLALSQMMSKGKVASQELRLQMGEKLPIAIQAMANAMGVSVAQLDKMLSKGELMANDVLPKFAEQLDKMSPKIDTNNLSASLTNMENAFGDLTEKLGVESKFKRIVDTITNGMIVAVNNMKTIISSAFLGIVFVGVNSIAKITRSWDKSAMEQVDVSKKLQAELIALKRREEVELERLNNLRIRQNAATGNRQIKLAEDVALQEKKYAGAVVNTTKKEIELADATNTRLSKTRRGLNALNIGLGKIGGALKALWRSFAPAIIVTGLVAIVSHFKNMLSKAKELRDVFSSYKDRVGLAGSTEEITKLKALQKLHDESAGSIEQQKKYKAEIVKLLGSEYNKEKGLNELINKRIGLLEKQAKIERYTQEKINAEEAFQKASKKLDFEGLSTADLDKIMSNYNLANEAKMGDTTAIFEATGQYSKFLQSKGKYYSLEVDKLIKQAAPFYKIIKDAEANIKDLMGDVIKASSPTTYSNSTDNTELDKLQDKYAKSLAELDVKLQYALITQDEYNKSRDDLVKSSFVEAKLSKDEAVARSKYLKNLEDALKNPLYDENSIKLKKTQSEYNKSLTKLDEQLNYSFIAQSDYNSKLLSLIDKTIEEIESSDNVSKAQKEYVEKLKGIKAEKIEAIKETLNTPKRDTNLDYKKSKLDILNEELDLAKKNQDKIKELASANLEQFAKELNDVMANVTSLEEAIKLAEVKEDIKNLQKEIAVGNYQAAKSIMSGADSMVRSLERINDAFSNPDASGWERIMAIWDALTSTIDGFIQIVEVINSLTKATQMLSAAKQAQVTMETALLPQQIANVEAATAAEVTASQVKTTTATTEMAAKTTAAYSSIPFIGVGLAAAAIAAMFALIPKFKDGGIVGGGATTGDRMLARVNAGEMILNNTQQSNLWKMFNSQSSVKHTDVNIGGRVRGSDIYLSLSNYMKSSGRKLP